MAEASRKSPIPIESVAPAHVLVVEARFYDGIMDQLMAGTTAALTEAGATFDIVHVPGCLEVGGAIAIALAAGTVHYDAAIAVGCVMRGETYHFEVVSNESARALTDLSIKHALPIGNAVLTVEDEEQASVRADPARGNKGGEAAHAALALLRLKRRMGTR